MMDFLFEQRNTIVAFLIIGLIIALPSQSLRVVKLWRQREQI